MAKTDWSRKTPRQLRELVENKRLTDQQLTELQAYLQSRQRPQGEKSADTAALNNLVSLIDSDLGRPTDSQRSVIKDQAAKQVAAQLAAGQQVGEIDLSTLMSTNDAFQGMTPDEQKAFKDEAIRGGQKQFEASRSTELQAGGVDADVAARQAKDESQQGVLGSVAGNTPRWILESIGAPLDETQKSRVVEYWNDYFGTNFTSFDTDLSPLLQYKTAAGAPKDVQDIVAGAIAATEPEMTMMIKVPGKRDAVISIPQLQAMKEAYGLDNNSVSRLVRLTALGGQWDDKLDRIETQPTFAPLVALLAATGQITNVNKIADSKAAQELRDAQGARGFDALDARSAAIGRQKTASTSLTQDIFGANAGAPLPAGVAAPNAAATRELQNIASKDNLANPDRVAVQRLTAEYAEGLKRFNNNPTLAYLYALDHGLAERLAQSGGDPRKVAGSDNQAASKYLLDGGLINRGQTPFELLGGQNGDSVLRQMSDYFSAYGPEKDTGGAEPKRQMPDPVAVNQALTELWRATFRREPSEQLKTAFMSELQSTLSSTDINTSVDVTARIQDFIRRQPLYQDLYKNKAGGLTETEYQAMFESGVSSVLGNVKDEESIDAGMRSGNYQTSVLAAATGAGAKDNSTFAERLAEAANVISANT